MEAGPPLEALIRRLAECPADFLAAPRLSQAGTVQVAAVVSDLLVDLGADPLTPAQSAVFGGKDTAAHRNWLGLVLVAAWLLHDPWFLQRPHLAAPAQKFLLEGLRRLAELVKAPQCVADPDRREELARIGLKALGLYPLGESPAQAQDRLATLDSVERQRVVRAARQAEERAHSIREAMAQKAAQEAADKWTRE